MSRVKKSVGVLAGYGLMVNVGSFGLFWFDKQQAIQKQWRIPERTLYLSALSGGWIGGSVAMQQFKHKTVKQPFRQIYFGATSANIAILLLFLNPAMRSRILHRLPTLLNRSDKRTLQRIQDAKEVVSHVSQSFPMSQMFEGIMIVGGENRRGAIAFVPSTFLFDRILFNRSYSVVSSTILKCQDRNANETCGLNENLERRQVLKSIAASAKKSAFVAAIISSLVSSYDEAYAQNEAREGVAQIAAKIPGYGQPDIFYPESFIGSWNVIRTLSSVRGTDVDRIARFSEFKGKSISYQMRFVKHRGHVIADREYNVCNVLSAPDYSSSSSPSKREFDCMWQRENPNVITATRRSGFDQAGQSQSVIEMKVTKRSFTENPAGPGSFDSSEYMRTVETNGADLLGGTPPVLGAKRELWRYKIVSDNFIDALLSENFYNPESSPSAPPVLALTYRVQFRK